MVIKKVHALHLLALLEKKEAGITPEKLNDNAIEDLAAAGLVHFPDPAHAALGYAGEMVARALREALNEGVDHPNGWQEDFRWIGSEILAMMRYGKRNGAVSRIAADPLVRRGLAKTVYDKGSKTERTVLTQAGEDLLRAFEIAEPELVIDEALAQAIVTSPEGPTEAGRLNMQGWQKERLEAMRLLAYSVPRGDIAAFTGIGKAVREVIQQGAVAVDGVVIDSLIIDLLAAAFDGEEIAQEAKVQLEAMGYLDDRGELLPAGEALMRLRALLKRRREPVLKTFALTQEMAETLECVVKLEEATVEAIKKEMVDKKVAEFEALKERYGRRLDEMPALKRKILEGFLEAKERMAWFESHFDIREYLYALEAFDLITEGVGGYRATRYGLKIVEEEGQKPHPVSSSSVKTVLLARRPFDVPNGGWVAKAREEKILGDFGPGPRGRFYVDLADSVVRKPFLSRFEADLFKRIPERGESVERLLEACADEHERRRTEAALDMLEARGLIEVLADGHIIETEAGRLMDRALSGVPEGFGAPVNPLIWRVVKAVAEVGTLYEKERRIRLMPRQHKAAYERSGLDAERFNKAWVAAKEAKYLGKNGVNEAGMDLLEAVEAMNA